MLRNIYTTATLITFIAAAIASTPLAATAQTIWYVDDDAYGNNTGQSWQDAFTDLQDALDAATNGHEIHVAAGTYYPSKRSDPQDPRSASFQLINGVSIIGGYAGLSEPQAPDTRDTTLYETILSGDLLDNDITTNGPDFDNNGENCYHIFYHPTGINLDETAVLDGFTLCRTMANGSDWPDEQWGGGMYNHASSPTVINCTFRWNSAAGGAGVCNNENSSPLISFCMFVENSSPKYGQSGGAGVYNQDNSNPRIEYCEFEHNTVSSEGGAITSRNSLPSIKHCRFICNRVYPYYSSMGGAVCGDAEEITDCLFDRNSCGSTGGAVRYSCSTDHAARRNIARCMFTGNSAEDGGAIWIADLPESGVTISECSFINNQATFGGGILYLSSQECVLINNNFNENHASDRGGAAYFGGGIVKVDDCEFNQNTSRHSGGAIDFFSVSEVRISRSYFHGNSTNTYGGAVSLQMISTTPKFSNCSFVGNTAASGGAVFGSSPAVVNCTLVNNLANSLGGAICASAATNPSITNSILRGDSAPGGVQVAFTGGTTSSTITISHCNIEGGPGRILLDEGSTLNWGTGNIDLDPLFVRNPDAGTNGWDGSDDDYGDLHLTYRSPCIEAGNTDALPPDTNDINSNGDIAEPIPFDLDDNPRIIGCNVDIGPYEYQTNPILRGDYNADCYIDLDDYFYLQPCLTNSGPNTTPNQPDCTTIFDFNNDNDIDLHDFQSFQLSYSP